MCRTVVSGHCVSGSKPKRKDMIMQDTSVTLLEGLKTKLGLRQLFSQRYASETGDSHCLKRAVQAQRVSVKCH